MLDIVWNQFDVSDMANHFASSYWSHLEGVNGHHLVTLTGIVKCGDNDFIGYDSGQWTTKTLGLTLRFPLKCPPNQHFHIDTYTPFMTITGIDKGGDEHNGGWVVNDFDFGWPGESLDIYDQVNIRATIRNRGDEFRIFRLSYSVTVVGRFENN